MYLGLKVHSGFSRANPRQLPLLKSFFIHPDCLSAH
jgi:hypothetical protein